jgi:hypothetical protein
MTLTDQIWEMRRKWPNFKVTHSHSWLVCWEGVLRPLGAQTYKVRITYQLPRVTKEYVFNPAYLPMVQVLEPKLNLENSIQDHEPLIHLYTDHANPDLPYLCLDDPVKSGWLKQSSIADTIVPWAIDWLVCYELWQATGKWTGGGRDHRIVSRDAACQPQQNTPQTLNVDLPGLYTNDAYQGLGPKLENFASSVLTAAVYAAFSQPPFSPRSKSSFCLPASESTSASTSSPELQRAA